MRLPKILVVGGARLSAGGGRGPQRRGVWLTRVEDQPAFPSPRFATATRELPPDSASFREVLLCSCVAVSVETVPLAGGDSVPQWPARIVLGIIAGPASSCRDPTGCS